MKPNYHPALALQLVVNGRFTSSPKKAPTSGDTYQGVAKDTDAHLGGLLSAFRNREKVGGDLGETFLFTPPAESFPAKRFMVIGLDEEKDLSLESLRVVGRIAAREAVRLKAKHVPWAPVIRDKGDSTIDVGEGDRTCPAKARCFRICPARARATAPRSSNPVAASLGLQA